jgi:hypothetical protein
MKRDVTWRNAIALASRFCHFDIDIAQTLKTYSKPSQKDMCSCRDIHFT